MEVQNEEVPAPISSPTMFCVTSTNLRFLALAYTCALRQVAAFQSITYVHPASLVVKNHTVVG